jgi:hypothetical protein
LSSAVGLWTYRRSPGLGILLNSGIHFRPRRRISAMDHSQDKKFMLAIEVIFVVAINVVVAAFGYYAITTWGLFSN